MGRPVGQVSPDKDVDLRCTAAPFTLPPEPVGFVVSCRLARKLSLLWRFCPPDRSPGQALARSLASGFLQTPSREGALAFG